MGIILGLAATLIGYLLGSIPSAYVITRLRKGIDIRDIDTGNVGAGSVFRQVGIWEGAVVSIVDIAKGAAAILIAQALGVSQPWVLGAGFASIIGHGFPIYIGFRGGQGVATIMGIFFVLTPEAMGITYGIIAVALLLTRNIFVSTVIASPFLLLSIWLLEGSVILLVYSIVIVIFVVFRSRRRLILVKTVIAKRIKEATAVPDKIKSKKKVI